MSVNDWCISKLCFVQVSLACQSKLGQKWSYEINFWCVTLSMISFLVHAVVDKSYVFSDCYVIPYDVTWILVVARRLLLVTFVKEYDRIQSVRHAPQLRYLCTIWNVHKEGDLMTTTFWTHKYHLHVVHWCYTFVIRKGTSCCIISDIFLYL